MDKLIITTFKCDKCDLIHTLETPPIPKELHYPSKLLVKYLSDTYCKLLILKPHEKQQ